MARRASITDRLGKTGKQIFFALFLLYIAGILIIQQVNQYHLSQQIKDMNSDLQVARKHNVDLRSRVNEMNSDAFIEKVAREELGMTRKGELLFAPLSESPSK